MYTLSTGNDFDRSPAECPPNNRTPHPTSTLLPTYSCEVCHDQHQEKCSFICRGTTAGPSEHCWKEVDKGGDADLSTKEYHQHQFFERIPDNLP